MTPVTDKDIAGAEHSPARTGASGRDDPAFEDKKDGADMLRKFLTISMIAGAVALAAAPGQTQQLASIGSVSGVQPDAFGSPPGQTRRTLAIQTDVFTSERVETQKSAWAQIRFRDNTDFRVGANSVVVLDRFVFDPQKKTGEMAINVTQGVFRFVTGTMNKDGYKIHTPSAVIGVRGTDFLLEVEPGGDTRVAVIEGMVEITPLRASQTALIAPNNQGSVDNGGNSVKVEPVPGDASGSSEKMTAWFDSDGSLGNGGGGPANGLSGQSQLRTFQTNPTPLVITPPPSAPPPAAPPSRMPGMKM